VVHVYERLQGPLWPKHFTLSLCCSSSSRCLFPPLLVSLPLSWLYRSLESSKQQGVTATGLQLGTDSSKASLPRWHMHPLCAKS
jgi:hypothetical protein